MNEAPTRANTAEVTVDVSRCRDAYQRSLVNELSALSGRGKLGHAASRRASEIIRKLIRFGVIVPTPVAEPEAGIVANPVPQGPIGVQAVEHG
jgi:hypothetical protein